jgi:hypothetical protein
MFSWLSPWFWLRTIISFDVPYTNIVTNTSPFSGWLEDGQGLENLLFEIFKGIPQEQIESIKSVAISTITTAAASFIGGYIAAKATEWNPLQYLIVTGIYAAAVLTVLSSITLITDADTTRAIFITAGWTLLSLSTLGFSKTIPIYLSNIIGSDPVTIAVRCLAKTIISVYLITPILQALGVSLSGFLFYYINFVLGLSALIIGYQIA